MDKDIDFNVIDTRRFYDIVVKCFPGLDTNSLRDAGADCGLLFMTGALSYGKREQFIVAATERDTEFLVGFAAVSVFSNGVNEQDRDALTSISVRNEYRNSKVASNMLQLVAQECIKRHRARIGVEGPPVLSLSTLEDDGFKLIPVFERLMLEYPELAIKPSELNMYDPRLSGLIKEEEVTSYK